MVVAKGEPLKKPTKPKKPLVKPTKPKEPPKLSKRAKKITARMLKKKYAR